ncbi:fMet-Leu-Phe receptor-like [Protobothrops mucrosquamatus]|uniref:fMet-Leu-Phe receptor-like n=1 Tax=Protobothrops mucrosquamatus TaxID=103944 RepID=UPI0007755E15|nr:fMet-Leu-Phe receptor-like [Protobothrops mucrosquamatus]
MSNTTFDASGLNNSVEYEYYYDYEDPTYKLERAMHVISMVIYSLAFVLGVLGNGLVIFITGFRMKKSVNTVWFLNLAIADFAFTFFLPLSIAYLALRFHWPFGWFLCKLNSTLAFVNLYASVYLLMIISIDRMQTTMRIGIPLVTSLAFVNSCLNPILYVFMGQDFKKRLRLSLFSVFENAFTEDNSQNLTTSKTKSSAETVSQEL